MKTAQMRGFTLIELLTVIAIMAILMALAVTTLPRALEKAKITDVETDMSGIHTAMTVYMADHGSYPPRYGYIQRGSLPTDPVGERFFLEPYTAHIGIFRALDQYDRFSRDTHDTDSVSGIQPLEFCPDGVYNAVKDRNEFLNNVRYDGTNGAQPDIAAELEAQSRLQRPYVYLPINTAQFKKFKKEVARTGDLTSQSVNWPALWSTLNFRFPPPKYDAFVLISLGPQEGTFGILPSNETGDAMYHKLALRAYYLATRDINNGGEGNGELDFDFRPRTRHKESTILESEAPGLGFLPDGQPQAGPLIEKFE